MLGDFLNDLKTAGLYDNTAMVVSSDHGEEFSDHGLLGHTSLYQENISVPFLVRLPETMYPLDPPELVPHRFEAHTTIFKIIMDMFEHEYPNYVERSGSGGLSLEQLTRLTEDREVFAELTRPRREGVLQAAMLLRDGRKVILSYPASDSNSRSPRTLSMEVFDLRDDPDERRNLCTTVDCATFSDRATLLGAVHDKIAEVTDLGFRAEPGREFSREEIRRLRALGYLR